jgi:hypothetical protein
MDNFFLLVLLEPPKSSSNGDKVKYLLIRVDMDPSNKELFPKQPNQLLFLMPALANSLKDPSLNMKLVMFHHSSLLNHRELKGMELLMILLLSKKLLMLLSTQRLFTSQLVTTSLPQLFSSLLAQDLLVKLGQLSLPVDLTSDLNHPPK